MVLNDSISKIYLSETKCSKYYKMLSKWKQILLKMLKKLIVWVCFKLLVDNLFVKLKLSLIDIKIFYKA